MCWKPPGTSTTKINYDAYVRQSQSGVGLGIVARNSSGEVLVWRRQRELHVQCLELAETVAARLAV